MFPDSMQTAEGKILKVFRKGGKKRQHFSHTFLKAWKAGKFENTDSAGNYQESIGELVNNRKYYADRITKRNEQMRYMHETYKSVAKDRDKWFEVDVLFKSWVGYDKEEQEDGYEYWTEHYKLSIPVLRKLIIHKHSEGDRSEIIYDFLLDEFTKIGKHKGNMPTPSNPNYERLEAFMSSLVELEELKKMPIDGVKKRKDYFHTAKFLRDDFESLIMRIDDLINGGSTAKLVRMETKIISKMRESGQFEVVKPSQIEQMDQAMHFTTFLVKNDVNLTYDDGITPKAFELRTGQTYRQNSCLATIVIYFMYHSDNSRLPKYLYGKKKNNCSLVSERRDEIKRLYGVDDKQITYDLVSRACGVPFRDDGSLVLTFQQLERFVSLYSQPVMVVSTKGKYVWDFKPDMLPPPKPPSRRTTIEEPRARCMIVSHHNHCRLVGENNQQKIQTFQHKFQNKITKPEEVDTIERLTNLKDGEELKMIGKYYIREDFDAPALCINQQKNDSLQDIAQLILNKLVEFADQQEQKIQEKDSKKVKGSKKNAVKDESNRLYLRCHFVGDIANLMLTFRDYHRMVAGNIIYGKSGTIKSFNLHQKDAIIVIGNVGLEENKVFNQNESALMDLDESRFGSAKISQIELEKYNYHYANVYKALLNHSTLSYYASSKQIGAVWDLRCRPLVGKHNPKNLQCVGAVDANKYYTSLLVNEMSHIPVFDQLCVFQTYDGHEMEDWTLYAIKQRRGNQKFLHGFLFDRFSAMYYGKVIKMALDLLPDLEFDTESYCRPRRVTEIDVKDSIRTLYEDKSVSNKHKKDIVNFCLGMVDQHIVSRQSGEFFGTEQEATAFQDQECPETDCLCLEDVSGKEIDDQRSKELYSDRLEDILDNKHDDIREQYYESKYKNCNTCGICNLVQQACECYVDDQEKLKYCSKEVRIEYEKLKSIKHFLEKEENMLRDDDKEFIDLFECRYDDICEKEWLDGLDDAEKREIEGLPEAERTIQYLGKVYSRKKHIFINMYRTPKKLMRNGFLFVSILKYQMARIGLLQLWTRIEQSKDLVPIGVRTDCVYCAKLT